MIFFEELRDVTSYYAASDGYDRLFLLEMVDDEYGSWQEIYRNETLNEAVIPYLMGELPWGYQ